MFKRYAFLVFAISLVISMLLMSCSKAASTTTAATSAAKATDSVKTILIGDIENLTGASSDQLKTVADGVDLAKDYINEKGGVTINGQKYLIEVILQDNKMSAESATAAATSLIFDKKVNFIVGSLPTHIMKAIHTVTEANKMIYATCWNTGTAEEYGPTTPYQFVTWDSSLEQMSTAFAYLKEKYPDVKTIASINVDDGQLKEMDVHIQKFAVQYGYTIKDSIGWTLDTVDFTPTVQKALAQNADAIMTGNGSNEMAGQVLRIARELGYTKPIMAWNQSPARDILTIAGTSAGTNWFSHGMDENTPNKPGLSATISERAMAKYGKLDMLQLDGFNCLYTLIQAVEAAQSLDSTAVKNAWEKMTTIDTVFGSGKIGGLETYGIAHSVYGPIPMQAMVDGKIVDLGFFETSCP